MFSKTLMTFPFALQTFKQKKKNIPEGTMRYDLHKRANASLQSGIDVKQVVKLPPEEDLNDWVAVHGSFNVCCMIERKQMFIKVFI